MEKNNKKTRVYLLLIIVLAGLLRAYKINSPVLDLYPMRQEQCAMLARNFYRSGFSLFNSQVDWFGSFNSSWVLDFPLASYLTSLLYGVFGIHEFLGRLVAVLFSLGSVYFLFKLTELFFDGKTALLSSLFFAISPLNIYFGRAFMPEASLIFFSISTLYFLQKWLEAEKNSYYLAVILTTSAVFLVKITSLYLLGPILFLCWIKYRSKIFIKWRLWLYLTVSIALALLWYSRANFGMGGAFFSPDNFGPLLTNDFYRRIFESLSIFVVTPIGLILFVSGLFLNVHKKIQYLFHVWLIFILLYMLLSAQVNYIHYYYQLPLLPVGAVFIGRTLTVLTDKEFLKRYIIFPRFITPKVLISLFFAAVLFMSLLSIRPFYRWNRVSYEVAKKIERLTPKDAVIIAGRCTQEALLYYCDRKGWEINEEGRLSYSWAYKGSQMRFDGSEIELVNYLISHGADYYVTTNMAAFKKNSALVDYMRKNFRVMDEGKDFVIFKLS